MGHGGVWVSLNISPGDFCAGGPKALLLSPFPLLGAEEDLQVLLWLAGCSKGGTAAQERSSHLPTMS